jgi:hypothetical protein
MSTYHYHFNKQSVANSIHFVIFFLAAILLLPYSAHAQAEV